MGLVGWGWRGGVVPDAAGWAAEDADDSGLYSAGGAGGVADEDVYC